MFVMKKNSGKQEILEDILLFLSSKEVQEGSYVAANNLPAYKNAAEEFNALSGNSIEAILAENKLKCLNLVLLNHLVLKLDLILGIIKGPRIN